MKKEDSDLPNGGEEDGSTAGPAPSPSTDVDGIYTIIFWQLSLVWNHLGTSFWNFTIKYGLYDLFDKMARKAMQHPFITLFLAITILSVGLPLLVVTVLAFSTVVLTFTGFILLEVLLFGCLGAILIVFLFFAGVTIAGYFGFMHIYDLYQGVHDKSAITDYLQQERKSRRRELSSN
ncbi:uncharacterized protein LOC119656854 isoform X2 [Hermetia illucens]|uniref:uncharacterized protein LOC119656854 isoform X2 n=1 Tax=Hermetia illucens TaxID=343691 RepID=UPI0018CC237F|nr:uncharacterized protein LOC119656854 isoform X2 [Hermetia illucens]